MRRFRAPLSPSDLAELGTLFRAGGIVLVPTDTVYGVAAVPERADALARIVAAKGRDPSKPCQLLSASAEAAAAAGIPLPLRAAALARAFWPGALTLVLDLPQGGTEGVRVPHHAVARDLCAAAGGLLRCTSANRSGEPPARTAAEAEAALPSADAVVDAGPAPGGVASTVAKVVPDGSLVLFREGAIPRAALEAVLADVPAPLPRWLWLDPALHPDLQFCEARRLAGRPLPDGQKGFAVVAFRGRVAFPGALAGPLRIRVSADCAYRLSLDGAPLASGPAPAPGDWLPLPVLPCWFADEVVVPRPPRGEALFEALVRLGEARLCETSAGRGGFFFEGEAPLADGSVFRFSADASWRVRVLPGWRGAEEFDASVPPGPWETPAFVPDVWCTRTAPIPVREEIPRDPPSGGAPEVAPGAPADGVAEWPRIFAGGVRVRADGPCEVVAKPFETDPAAPCGAFRVRFGEEGGEALSPPFSVGGLVLSARSLAFGRPVRVRAGAVETRYPEDPARAGSFRCSDPGLEKVWDLCRHALGICRQNLHLDSPKHQEMLACAGDYHVESLGDAATCGDLRLAAFDLRRIARMLEVADGRMFHTSYGPIWVLWLRDVWRLTGDADLVRDCLPAVDRLLRRFETYLGPSGLLENPPDWMFLDWLVVEGFSLHHPPRALGQTALVCWYAGALDAAAELRAAVGGGPALAGSPGSPALPGSNNSRISSGSPDGQAPSWPIRRAARSLLFDPSSGLWLDGLDTPDPGEGPWRPANPRGLRRHGAHANILAALFGFSEGEEARGILRRALSGDLGPFQPWFAHWALEAAERLGLFAELGMPLLRRWIPSVEACSKGLAEGWHEPEPGYAFDHSHAWGASPAWQLPVRLLGLRVEEPGFRRVSFAPDLMGLEWARIVLPTPFGPVRAELRAGAAPELSVPDGIAWRFR